MDGTGGRVTGIFVADAHGAPVVRVPQAEAVAGAGLRGDRWGRPEAGAEVTLFAEEDLAAARAESGLDLHPEDLRRNLMTSGADLVALRERVFRVGEVVLEGTGDNPPCAHLQRLAGKPLLTPLAGRAGITARIVRAGTVREGDVVRLVTDAALA